MLQSLQRPKFLEFPQPCVFSADLFAAYTPFYGACGCMNPSNADQSAADAQEASPKQTNEVRSCRLFNIELYVRFQIWLSVV